MKNIQRVKLSENFRISYGYERPKQSQGTRTDWSADAAVLVGICGAMAMIVAFYFIF